jgi:quercetin dioxygenase-like cupin family protein
MKTALSPAGDGPTVWVVGDRYTIKTSGADTAGAFALIEAVIPPGAGPPPHIHRREDEAFYVLEGTLQFHTDGRTFDAAPGAWITLERGSTHFFRNVSDAPARMLILVTPAGLEDFFLEIGRPATSDAGAAGDGTPTPEDIARLIEAAPRYGLEILPPPGH